MKIIVDWDRFLKINACYMHGKETIEIDFLGRNVVFMHGNNGYHVKFFRKNIMLVVLEKYHAIVCLRITPLVLIILGRIT